MSFRARRGRASFSVSKRGPRAGYRLGCVVPALFLSGLAAVACSSTPAQVFTTLTITSPANGSTVSSSPVMVLGKAPAGSRIVQDISLAPDQETVAGSAGTWSLSVALDPGSNVLTFRIGDDQTTAQSIAVTLSATGGGATATPGVVATPGPIVTVRPPSGTYAALTKRAFSQLVKAPDDHVGEQYVVWACVTQFDAATGADTFRGDAYFEKNGPYWFDAENSFFTGDAGELADFVKDDVVRMNVRVLGSITYDTQIGGSTTVPSFYVDAIEQKGGCG